jgi:hypothetical protein
MPAAYTPTDLASIGVLPKIPGPAQGDSMRRGAWAFVGRQEMGVWLQGESYLPLIESGTQRIV